MYLTIIVYQNVLHFYDSGHTDLDHNPVHTAEKNAYLLYAINVVDVLVTTLYNSEAMMNIVLYQPEIPQNTGAIARHCVGMNAHLHIVKPIPFEISDKTVKRAGLDYWDHLKLTIHDNREIFMDWLGDREPWIITKHGTLRYDEPDYAEEDIFIFGRETGGLPQDLIALWPERTVNIPILGKIRSYNLANTVSIVLAQANLKAGIFGRTGITED